MDLDCWIQIMDQYSLYLENTSTIAKSSIKGKLGEKFGHLNFNPLALKPGAVKPKIKRPENTGEMNNTMILDRPIQQPNNKKKRSRNPTKVSIEEEQEPEEQEQEQTKSEIEDPLTSNIPITTATKKKDLWDVDNDDNPVSISNNEEDFLPQKQKSNQQSNNEQDPLGLMNLAESMVVAEPLEDSSTKKDLKKDIQ